MGGGRRERQNGGRGGVEEERVTSKEQLDGFVVTRPCVAETHGCGWGISSLPPYAFSAY